MDRSRTAALGAAGSGDKAAGWTTGWTTDPVPDAGTALIPAVAEPADDGCRNTAEFLRLRLRISASEARRRLTLAATVLPGTETAPGPGSGPFVFSGPVTASTVRKIACDADIIPVLLGSEGRILDIGRTTRIFPPHIRSPQRPRPRLRLPQLHHPRPLVRSPPHHLLVTGRTHQHRQRRPALQPPPPPQNIDGRGQ